jgi:hypothetical protein
MTWIERDPSASDRNTGNFYLKEEGGSAVGRAKQVRVRTS